VAIAALNPNLEPVGWNLDPATLALGAILSLAYARRVHTLARRGRHVSAWRRLSFHLGVLVLVLALVSPIDALGDSRVIYAHMIQHLAIGELAPLLILVGVSGPILRPLLALPAMIRLRPLMSPLVALPLWGLNLYVWHIPALYELAFDHEAVHALMHACFFWVGLLMWGALIEPLPGPSWFGSGAKAAYVLVVRLLGCAILGNALIWIGKPLYPFYAPGEHAAGISPLADQQLAGAIMFVWGAFVTIFIFSWFFLRWTQEAELRQSLLDAGTSARVAGRAARYGRRPADPAPPPPSP
jgi:cytochrome c oxidase assembly factor CtaG